MHRLVRIAWVAPLFGCAVAFAQSNAERYTIVAAESDLHWRVYKAGAMARLGHNHTIGVGDLRGEVTVDRDNLAASSFEMEFSVANLVVDETVMRSRYGNEFASVPTADDIAGTRRNMLSERVLAGEMFPTIRLVGTGPVVHDGTPVMAVQVTLLGRTVALTVPTKVTVDDGTVRAVGQFELNHADLGMQPFSVMMGALQVAEKLSFAYDIAARRSTH